MKIAIPNGTNKPYQLVVMSEEKWNQIEVAIESGNELALKKLVMSERDREKELDLAEIDGQIDIDGQYEKNDVPKSSAHFMYNSLSYDSMSRDELMDAVTKFARKNNIPMNALRYAIQNIDDDYTVKYEAQYNQSVRDLVSEDDLGAMFSDDESETYYEEKTRREEQQKRDEQEYDFFAH